MTEEWRPIRGFEAIYSVSDHGRVRRDAGGRGAMAGRILTAKVNQKGYCYVDLSRNDHKTRRLIHQLVCEAFLPPRPSPKHHPNHIDTNKKNNHDQNLEWLTIPENTAHARDNGLFPSQAGEENGNAVLTAQQVLEIRELKGSISQRAIAARFGIARSTVGEIHRGRNWRADTEDLRVREYPTQGRAL